MKFNCYHKRTLPGFIRKNRRDSPRPATDFLVNAKKLAKNVCHCVGHKDHWIGRRRLALLSCRCRWRCCVAQLPAGVVDSAVFRAEQTPGCRKAKTGRTRGSPLRQNAIAATVVSTLQMKPRHAFAHGEVPRSRKRFTGIAGDRPSVLCDSHAPRSGTSFLWLLPLDEQRK